MTQKVLWLMSLLSTIEKTLARMPLRSLCNLSYDLMNVSLKSGFRSLPITKETNRCHLIVCTVSKNAIKHLFFIGS